MDYLKEIYPSQLTVEKANKSDHLADYLDLTFIIDSGGKLSAGLYDKRDDFDFHIVNFPFLSSNIPSGPSYGVYISQLIRYARCCSHYDDFGCRHGCLVGRLLSRGYKALRLEKSFGRFYGRCRDLVGGIGGQSMRWWAIHSQDNFYLTCSRNLVAFVICMGLSLGFVCAWVGCWLWRVSCMKRTALARSGAPGRIVGWTSFSHWRSMHGSCRNFQHYTGFVYYLFFSFWWVLGFLCVYGHRSVLECYNLFSGVELSMRSFFVIRSGLRCYTE